MDKLEKRRILEQEKYKFLREMIANDEILYLTLTGSHSYGTDVEDSDVDIRGIMKTPVETLLGNVECFGYDDSQETGNTDTVLYTTNHFFTKLKSNNPVFIEILSSREEDILYITPLGQKIKDNVDLFITQTAFFSFEGYALSLLNRIERVMRSDFEKGINQKTIDRFEMMKYSFNEKYSGFEQNSIILKDEDKELKLDIDLKDYPLVDFYAMMSEFENMITEYEKKKEIVEKQKTDKLKGRNKKTTPEKLNKHIMHLIRLLLEGIELGSTGKLSTYRPKEQREELLAIRNGKYYDFENDEVKDSFFEYRDELISELKKIRENTILPRRSEKEVITDFIVDINRKTLE